MRTLTAIAAASFAVAVLPGVGAAQDDRYGPASASGEYASATSGPVGAPAYNGPYLSWTSKSTPTQPAAAPTEVATQDSPPPERLRGPQSFLTAAVHQHHPSEPAPAYIAPNASPDPPAMAAPPRRAPVLLQPDPTPAPLTPAPPPVAAAAPKPAPPAMVAAAPKPRRRSPMLAVARPAPKPAPPARAVATVAPSPIAPPTIAPAPAPLAAAPVPAPQPQAVAEAAATPPDALPPGTTGGRFYSVDRDYGLAPDPVPPPQDRAMVLIGPADNGPQTGSSDSDSDAGDSDKGEGDKGDADKAGGGD